MAQAADDQTIDPVGVRRYLAQLAIVFAAQFAAGKLGDVLQTLNKGGIGPVWPAAGVAVGALLLCGYSVWPGVAAGAFLLAFFSPLPHWAAAVYAAGTTLAALLATFLLRRIAEFDNSFSHLRDVLALIVFGAFGSSVVSASVGASTLYAAHIRGWSGFCSAWLVYWLGDSTGVLLVTPLVLTLPTLFQIRGRHRLAEFAVLLVLLTTVSFTIFGALPPLAQVRLPFVVVLFVIWAAIRFGMSETALSIVLIATIATLETALGSGPFTTNTRLMNAVLLDVFFAVVSGTGLTLAAICAERERAQGERERLIRERAEAEAQLRFAAIVESSDDAIVSKTPEAVIVSWNKGAQRIYGYAEAEVVGKPIAILVPPELAEEENKILERLRAGERIEHYETIRLSKTGKRINVSLSISPIKDSSGRTVGISGIARDITERKLAEERLRESEERLRLAVQAGKMYAYEWDLKTDVLVRSPEYVSVLGVTEPRILTYKQVLEKIHPDDRPKLVAAVARHSPKNPTVDVAYRVLLSGKSPIWVKSSGRAFFDGEGRMLRVVGIVADITDQKLAEESLRASEERLRLAQKAAGVGTFERNVRTGVNTWTAEMESIYGLPPGGFGQTLPAFEHLVHRDDRSDVIKLVDKALRTGQTTSGEWRVIWPDGSVHWIAGRWQLLMDESGEPLRVVGVNIDITERKRAEEALRKSEEKFSKAFRQSPMALTLTSAKDHRYLDVNETFERLTGWCRDEVIGQTPFDISLWVDSVQRVEFANRLMEEGVIRDFEVHYRRKDGVERVALGSAELIEIENEPCILSVIADVTDRKQAEEALSGMSRKLIQAQEQERTRIGRELHDDISQRLAMLSLELEQLRENPSEIETSVQKLRTQIAEISSDVQALSHDLHATKLEYLGAVAGMKSWCREFAERQKIEIDFRSHVHSVLPSEVSLSLFRVLQEALYNASKHSGVKRVEVQLREDSDEIHLVISDSGKGFDVERAMHGKGLGLTSMRERVRLLDGSIAIDSKPMGGTAIRVRVPLKSQHGSQQAAV